MTRRVSIILTLTLAMLVGMLQGQPTEGEKQYPDIRIGIDAVGVWQGLTHRNNPGTLPEINTGFQAAVGNLRLNAAVADGIDVYVELYLSSKHHPGVVYDREGYVLLRKLPKPFDFEGVNTVFRYLDIKAGHFEVDFGNTHLMRSDNAQVQRNPLVGNWIVDPNTVEFGVEFIGTHGIVNGLVGIGNGGTVEDFQSGHQYSRHAKVWVEDEDEMFNVAASIYRVNQSANPTGYPNNGSFSELFGGNRSGSRYSAVVEGGAEAGQIRLGRGQDLTAWQFDATVDHSPVRVTGLFGGGQDMDINGAAPGTPSERWRYYGGELVYDLVPSMLYLAGRYSTLEIPSYRGLDLDGRVNRTQAGFGFWITSEMLLKLEYVNQRYAGLNERYIGDPRFSGVTVEMSVSF